MTSMASRRMCRPTEDATSNAEDVKEDAPEGATAGDAPSAIDEEEGNVDQAPPPPSLEFLEKKWSGMAKCKTLPNDEDTRQFRSANTAILTNTTPRRT